MPAANTRADALVLTTLGSSYSELQHLHAVGTIPGVRVILAAGLNGPGTGVIHSLGDGQSLQWRAPGSATFGEAVWCGSDGIYLLEDGEDRDKWIRVQVYVDHLFAGSIDGRVYLADRYHTRPDSGGGAIDRDFTASEALSGASITYMIQIVNASAFDPTDVKLWIDPDHVFDPVTGNGLEIINDVDWVAPDAEGHVDVLTWDRLLPGVSGYQFMGRRAVAAGESAAPNLLECLHISFMSYG